MSPQNGSGSSQVFQFVFSDSNGYQGLFSGSSHILINSSVNGTNSCWLQVVSTGIYLAPDDPNRGWMFVGYGSTTVAQNSQCAVSGAGTTASGSGNTLTLNLSLSFRPSYAGTQTVYTDVGPSSPNYAGVTTYTVTATAPDYTLAVSPSSLSVQAGQSPTATVTAAAQNGFNQNITLSAGSLPLGVSATFNPTVLSGGSGASTLTLTASPSAPGSNGPIGITGTASSVSHTATAQLTVTQASPPPPSVAEHGFRQPAERQRFKPGVPVRLLR